MQQNIHDSLNTDMSNYPNNNYIMFCWMQLQKGWMHACLQKWLKNLTRKNIKKTHGSLSLS